MNKKINQILEKIASISLFTILLICIGETPSYAGYFTGAVSKEYYCQSSFFTKYRYIESLEREGKTYTKVHTGWDYVPRDGVYSDAFILAVGDGIVRVADSTNSNEGNGTNVVIEHTLASPLSKSYGSDKTKIYSRYSHMIYGSLRVGVGDKVKAGTVIGRMGNTGSSSSTHLDLKIQDSERCQGTFIQALLEGAKSNTMEKHWDSFSYANGTTYYDFQKINFMLGPYVDIPENELTPGKTVMVSPTEVPITGELHGDAAGNISDVDFSAYEAPPVSKDAGVLVAGTLRSDMEITSDNKELSVGGDKSDYGYQTSEIGGLIGVMIDSAGAIAAIAIYVGIVSVGIGLVLSRKNAEERSNIIGALLTIGIAAIMLGVTDIILNFCDELIG